MTWSQSRSHFRAVLLGALSLAVAASACGGKETVASRSAAEFDRAQQKGEATTGSGEDHGGHATAGHEAPERNRATPAIGETSGMDHSNMDHSKMPGMKTAPRGATPASPMTGMDHSKMDHSSMPGMAGMAMTPPRPEPASATAHPGQPAATLRTDAIDGPAPTAVAEAARAAATVTAGHAMAHGTYSHTDAGRAGAAPQPRPSPAADPHHGHGTRPSPVPSPPPRPEEDRR